MSIMRKAFLRFFHCDHVGHWNGVWRRLCLTAYMKRYHVIYSSSCTVGACIICASMVSAPPYHTFEHVDTVLVYVINPCQYSLRGREFWWILLSRDADVPSVTTRAKSQPHHLGQSILRQEHLSVVRSRNIFDRPTYFLFLLGVDPFMNYHKELDRSHAFMT